METLPTGPTIFGEPLLSPKTCQCCGRVHNRVPVGSPMSGGYYWFNCECNSTLITPAPEAVIYYPDFSSTWGDIPDGPAVVIDIFTRQRY